MLRLDLPVRADLRGRPLQFVLTPMTSTGHGGSCCHVTVETVDEPIERQDLDLEQCSEALWIGIHKFFREGMVFVVPA